ncbi:uncharacterized protein [Miscanthus floridulus]|uniref:uncharacterized protein isoform X2 n=1 Tax=Miscanthus floridulus TaxID=154761 RepID=UPI003457C60B
MAERQATQIEQPGGTRSRLESYAPSLARAREAWSVATAKATEFDSIFKLAVQELEVRASQQEQLIHANLAAEVARLKQQHSEE